MTALFLKLLNQSIAASYLIAAVLVLRLLLKKAPKRFSVLLWGLVAVRAVCPFSLESALSLLPRAQAVTPEIMTEPVPQIDSGVTAINHAVNPVLAEAFTPAPAASANPLQILLPVLAALWLAGAAGMALYAGISYMRLCGRVRTAVLLRDNIFCTESAPSPFLLGLVRPRVYLPFGMAQAAQEAAVAHEQAHIRRGDHWWKLAGFAVLALHWMNPLMWLAYALLCRDIELACDESVIRKMDAGRRADYSEALLMCSAESGRGAHPLTLRVCPLTFSEGAVKTRIKAVLHYRKPAVWLVAAAAAACVITAVCFLTDPAGAADPSEPTGSPTEAEAGSARSLVVGAVFVSDQCVYMNPASSVSAFGGSGCTYSIEEHAFIITTPTGEAPYLGQARTTRIPVSRWAWQAFPFTDEEWEANFVLLPDGMAHMNSQYEELRYQPLDSNHYLLSADGALWLAETRGEPAMLWSIYSLVRQTANDAQGTLYAYDIGEAARMVDSAEWLGAWLQTQDSITRSDAEALIAALNQTVPSEGTNIVLAHMMDAAHWDNSDLQTLALRHDTLAPTVYHEGVSLVSATEERNCMLEKGDFPCTYHNSILRIRKEYTGSNPALRGWFCEYIFTRRQHDGPWEFTAMNGTYNVTDAALPLKEAFYTKSYAGFSPD